MNIPMAFPSPDKDLAASFSETSVIQAPPRDVPTMSETVAGIAKVGDSLEIDEAGRLSVDTADEVTEDDTRPITAAAVFAAVAKVGPGTSITDDGDGNVTIIFSGSVSVTDDGSGNVVIS